MPCASQSLRAPLSCSSQLVPTAGCAVLTVLAVLCCAALTVLPPGGVLSLMLQQEPDCALHAVCSVCVADHIAMQLSRSQVELLAEASEQLMQLMDRWKLNIHASAGSEESTELQPELDLLESLLDDDWRYNYDDEEEDEESGTGAASENTEVIAAAQRCVPCFLSAPLLPRPPACSITSQK